MWLPRWNSSPSYQSSFWQLVHPAPRVSVPVSYPFFTLSLTCLYYCLANKIANKRSNQLKRKPHSFTYLFSSHHRRWVADPVQRPAHQRCQWSHSHIGPPRPDHSRQLGRQRTRPVNKCIFMYYIDGQAVLLNTMQTILDWLSVTRSPTLPSQLSLPLRPCSTTTRRTSPSRTRSLLNSWPRKLLLLTPSWRLVWCNSFTLSSFPKVIDPSAFSR